MIDIRNIDWVKAAGIAKRVESEMPEMARWVLTTFVLGGEVFGSRNTNRFSLAVNTTVSARKTLRYSTRFDNDATVEKMLRAGWLRWVDATGEGFGNFHLTDNAKLVLRRMGVMSKFD